MPNNNNNNNNKRDRQTDKQTDRQTDRQRQREFSTTEDVTKAVGKLMYTTPRLLKSLSNVAREQVRNVLISLRFSIFHFKE